MCKRWQRQLALLLTGLGRVAALLALLNLIPTNSFAWDEYTHALSGEPITFTFLLTTTATPTTAPSIPQTPSLTEAAETGGGGPNIFIIAGIVGLFGLLGVALLALLLWRQLRRPTPEPPPPHPVPTAPYLQSLDTAGGPRKFLLDKPDMLIGRDQDADLRIDETFDNWETVSRQHARITHQGDQVIIQDNDSLNGIAVNGRRTRRNLLKQGWRLEIGGVAFVFHAGDPPSIPPTGEQVGGGRNAQ